MTTKRRESKYLTFFCQYTDFLLDPKSYKSCPSVGGLTKWVSDESFHVFHSFSLIFGLRSYQACKLLSLRELTIDFLWQGIPVWLILTTRPCSCKHSLSPSKDAQNQTKSIRPHISHIYFLCALIFVVVLVIAKLSSCAMLNLCLKTSLYISCLLELFVS